MKKVLLTVAVASLALSSNAFANRGGGKEGRESGKSVTETREQREARERKEGQNVAAGTSAQANARNAQAGEAVRVSGVRFSAADAQAAAKNLSSAMNDASTRSTIDTLVKNSSNEAGRTSLEVIAESAKQGLISTEAGQSLLKFISTQIAPALAKGEVTAETTQNMVTSLSKVSEVLREASNAGKSVDVMGALREGLKRAFPKKTAQEIEEILRKCFNLK